VAISVYDFFSVSDRVHDIDRSLDTASVGHYLTILAGVVGVVAGVMRASPATRPQSRR
jgi:hypothetical protein